MPLLVEAAVRNISYGWPRWAIFPRLKERHNSVLTWQKRFNTVRKKIFRRWCTHFREGSIFVLPMTLPANTCAPHEIEFSCAQLRTSVSSCVLFFVLLVKKLVFLKYPNSFIVGQKNDFLDDIRNNKSFCWHTYFWFSSDEVDDRAVCNLHYV